MSEEVYFHVVAVYIKEVTSVNLAFIETATIDYKNGIYEETKAFFLLPFWYDKWYLPAAKNIHG